MQENFTLKSDFDPGEIFPVVTLLLFSLVSVLDLIFFLIAIDVLVVFSHCLCDYDELCFER